MEQLGPCSPWRTLPGAGFLSGAVAHGGSMLEQLLKEFIPWEGPQDGTGESVRKDPQAKCDGPTPIPSTCTAWNDRAGNARVRLSLENRVIGVSVCLSPPTPFLIAENQITVPQISILPTMVPGE